MNEGWKRFHGTDEEVMWRIQVLKRTSRLCAAKAKELGSDYIVVGRPITQAENPVAAYRRCVAEFVG